MKQNLINLNLLQSKIFKNKQKILVLTSNNKESEHVVKKLQNDFKDIKIVNFPDREILPYDHFSTPDLILKQRVNAINNFEDSQILVSSFKNLLEYYPEKKFFLSKQLFKSGNQFNFNKFITMLKSMNFIQVEKVNAVGEFTIRGGIVDLHTINYENPLRFEFFDNKIESLRTYSLESQLSLEKIDEVYIGDSNEIPFNTEVVKHFKSKWREYFINNDESECSFFQKINSNKQSLSSSLGQAYNNNKQELFNKNSGFKNKRSEIVGNIIFTDASYNLSYDYRLSENFNLNRNNFNVQTKSKNLGLNLSYIQLKDFASTENSDTEQINYRFNYDINKSWNISFYQLRDLAGARYSVPLRTNLGVKFSNECTALQFTYTRDRSYDVDIPAVTNLSFNIKLFGF